MDKALAKKVFSFHGVATPRWAVVWRGRLDSAHDIDFPVIVKPAREDGSIGIGFDALAGNIKELMERIDQLHAEFDHPVLIEQYIDGREIYMGVLGNPQPEALPPVELDLSHLPKGTPRIAGTEVKWAEGTRAYRGSRVRIPKLSEDVRETMQRAAVTAFQALGLRDYARVDFRLARDGKVYLIEANPNPYLARGPSSSRALAPPVGPTPRRSSRSWSTPAPVTPANLRADRGARSLRPLSERGRLPRYAIVSDADGRRRYAGPDRGTRAGHYGGQVTQSSLM